MNLGGRIKVAIQRSGMTVPDICREARVPVATIHQLMRRDSKRSEYTEALLKVIPDDLVDKDWVRTGRGSPDAFLTKRSASAVVTPIAAAVGGKEMRTGAVPQIARAANVEPTGYNGGGSPIRTWEHQDVLPPGAQVFVPKLRVSYVPKGAGINGIEIVLLTNEVQAFDADWIRDDQLKPAGLAWVKPDDDSMEPVIYGGDRYVVNTNDQQIVDGKTFAVFYDGDVRARKCFTLPGGGLRLMANNNSKYPPIDLTAEQAKAVTIIGLVVHRAGRGGL